MVDGCAASALREAEGERKWVVVFDVVEVRTRPSRRSRVIGRKVCGECFAGRVFLEEEESTWLQLSPCEVYAMRLQRDAFVCLVGAGIGRPEVGLLCEEREAEWSYLPSLRRVAEMGLDWPETACHGDFRPLPRAQWLGKTSDAAVLRESSLKVGVCASWEGKLSLDPGAFARRLVVDVGAAVVFFIVPKGSFIEGVVVVESIEAARAEAARLGLQWLVETLRPNQSLHVPGGRTIAAAIEEAAHREEEPVDALGFYASRSAAGRRDIFKRHTAFLENGYRDLVLLPIYSRLASRDHTTWHVCDEKTLADAAYFEGSADEPTVVALRLEAAMAATLEEEDASGVVEARIVLRQRNLNDANAPIVLAFDENQSREDDFGVLAHCAQHGLLFRVDDLEKDLFLPYREEGQIVTPLARARREEPRYNMSHNMVALPLGATFPPWLFDDDTGALTDTALPRFRRRTKKIARPRRSAKSDNDVIKGGQKDAQKKLPDDDNKRVSSSDLDQRSNNVLKKGFRKDDPILISATPSSSSSADVG